MQFNLLEKNGDKLLHILKFIRTLILYIYSILPLDPRKVVRVHRIPYSFYLYLRNYLYYKKLNDLPTFIPCFIDSFPNLYDRFDTGGRVSRHYFYQDLWAARKIYQNQPSHHVDIGSRIDGFIAHLLVFMPVTYIDIRPLLRDVPGLTFVHGDATNLRSIPDNSVASISCLHAVEHFGLGRYGDTVEQKSFIRAIKEIQRIAARDIYFSVPIGQERLVFDSHRIFNPKTILDLFNECDVIEFSIVDDNNNLIIDYNIYDCNQFEDAV